MSPLLSAAPCWPRPPDPAFLPRGAGSSVTTRTLVRLQQHHLARHGRQRVSRKLVPAAFMASTNDRSVPLKAFVLHTSSLQEAAGGEDVRVDAKAGVDCIEKLLHEPKRPSRVLTARGLAGYHVLTHHHSRFAVATFVPNHPCPLPTPSSLTDHVPSATRVAQ